MLEGSFHARRGPHDPFPLPLLSAMRSFASPSQTHSRVPFCFVFRRALRRTPLTFCA